MKTLISFFGALMLGWASIVSAHVNSLSAEATLLCRATFVTLGTGINSYYAILGGGVDFKLLEKAEELF